MFEIVEMVEDDIIAKITRIVGYTPPGVKDLLHILAHPDVIQETKNYLALKEADNA